MHGDHRLLALARSQLGLVTRSQLLDLGVSRSAVDHWLRAGVLLRVHEGVYRHGAVPDAPHQGALAAVLACGPGSAASHRLALDLWGVPLQGPVPVEVTVVRESAPRPAGATVHRSRDLHPDHTTYRCGLPVTTPARSLVDAGQVLRRWEVESALEHLLRLGHVTLDQVAAALVLHARRGRPGIGALRRVLAERALEERPADSVLETAFARLCRDAELPVPELHPEIVVDGVVRHPDFGFEGTPVLVELDGYEHHGSREAFERDRRRDQALTAAGYTVLRFTWRQVVHQPHTVVATLLRVLAPHHPSVLGK